MGSIKTCPFCKSTNTKKKEIRNDNGVYGHGYFSWVVDSFYVCLDCGTRFDDIDRKE